MVRVEVKKGPPPKVGQGCCNMCGKPCNLVEVAASYEDDFGTKWPVTLCLVCAMEVEALSLSGERSDAP